MKTAIDPKIVKEANLRIHETEAIWYDRLHREIWNRAEQRRIRRDVDRICGLVKKGRVLDIGCGSGNLALKFLAKGHDVTGIDISPRMIRILEAKLKNLPPTGQIDLVAQDIDRFLDDNPGARFDVITLSSVLHHLPDIETFLGAVSSRLNDSGVLYICHEPTDAGPPSRITDFLRRIDPFISPRWFFARLRFRLLKGKADYSLSDCHQTIDTSILQKLLADDCLATDQLVHYNCFRNGLLVALDDLLPAGHKATFRLISIKNPSNQP